MKEVAGALIGLLEDDITDGLLVAGHDETCLRSLLNWTDTNEKIFKTIRTTPLVVPSILIADTLSTQDRRAPRNSENKAHACVYTLTLIADTPDLIGKIDWRVRDILLGWDLLSIPGMKIYSFDLEQHLELYHEQTKTYRVLLRYRARVIEIN